MGINIRSLSWRRWTTAALMGLTTLAGVVPVEAAPWSGRFTFAQAVVMLCRTVTNQNRAELCYFSWFADLGGHC